jgi:DNA-binding GntR family transcriptional regulator
LCSYRLFLEYQALDLALKLDPEGLFADLSRICEDMGHALRDDEFGRYLKLDAKFHEAFFTHCGNRFLHQGYGSVADVIATLRTHLSKAPGRTRKSFDEHTKIFQMVRDGSFDNAKTVLKKQVTRGERAYSELSRNSASLSTNLTSRV